MSEHLDNYLLALIEQCGDDPKRLITEALSNARAGVAKLEKALSDIERFGPYHPTLNPGLHMPTSSLHLGWAASIAGRVTRHYDELHHRYRG